MGDAVALKNKGNEFFKAKKYADAIEWYTKSLEADNASEGAGAVYSNRAASYMALGKYQECIADSEACVRLRPDWVKGHFRKSLALQAQGKLDESEKHMAQALTCEPKNEDIQDRIGQLRQQIRDRNEKQTPASCRTAQEAKQLGNSHFKTGAYEKAISFYTRAIEIASPDDPERGAYYVNRALCNAQTSSHKPVIADCDEALAIDPKNAKALLRRAMAYEGLEKWQKALDDYQMVKSFGLNSQPANDGATRCQRVIKSLY